jgi:hypothetical protein
MVTIAPAREIQNGSARFRVGATTVGTYHLSLPAPLSNQLWWFLPDGRVTAQVGLDENGIVLDLDSSAEYERLRDGVNRFDKGAVRDLN